MHLSLRRRDSTRPSTPPPQAAPAVPGTSGTPGTPDAQPYAFLSAAPSQSPPHGLKGLGRRMTSSKPVRMLKTIASRTSLRGHGRRQSASSVHSAQSVASQQEVGHERDLKEERESGETDYGKEVARASEQAAGKEKAAEVEQAAVSREGEQIEHEAEVRQEPAVKEPGQSQESEAHVEQTNIVSEEQATPAVKAVVEPAVDDVKDVIVKGDAEQAARGPEVRGEERAEEQPLTAPSDSIVLVPTENAETVSLSSSSTTVDHPAQPTDNNGDGSEELKQVKMEQESEPVQPVSLPESDARGVEQPAVVDINPFLVDDPEDPLSEPEAEREAASSPAAKSDAGTPITQSVVLSTQLESADSVAQPPALVVDEKQSAPSPPEKTLSAPSENSPSSTSSSSEEEAPELHTPALTVTSLFLPVPHTDPLSALLTKHVPEPHLRPPRDTSGEWQHTDFHTLVMTNNWRALARMARDRIVLSNPRDVELILNLWYIRLSSLARLRLFNQTSAECENLFSVLATVEPPTARAYILRNVLPFELEVLRAPAYWSGDHFGYLDDVAALLRRCRVRARQTHDPAEHSMWKERGARMALIVASQLVEMKDYTAAAALLEPLCASGSSPPASALRSALARIYLQGGLLSSAAAHFDAVDADPDAEPALKATNAVVRAAAAGDWAVAAEHARTLAEGEPGDVVAANNYAVALLGQGEVKEGIQVLETTLQASPSAATTAEPYLFNLSTMYELRAALTAHRKRDLLIEVAKWSGDGLRTACLKMNA